MSNGPNPRGDTTCSSCGDTFPPDWLKRERAPVNSWDGESVKYQGEDVFCTGCLLPLNPPFKRRIGDKV